MPRPPKKTQWISLKFGPDTFQVEVVPSTILILVRCLVSEEKWKNKKRHSENKPPPRTGGLMEWKPRVPAFILFHFCLSARTFITSAE